MGAGEVLQAAGHALELALWLAMPALVASFAVAAAIGVVQVATQLSDSTLLVVPKLALVAMVLLWTGGWMSGQLVHFTRDLWAQIALLAR